MRLGGGGEGGEVHVIHMYPCPRQRGCLRMMSSVGIAIDPSVDKETIVWVRRQVGRGRELKRVRREGQGYKGKITSEGVK